MGIKQRLNTLIAELDQDRTATSTKKLIETVIVGVPLLLGLASMYFYAGNIVNASVAAIVVAFVAYGVGRIRAFKQFLIFWLILCIAALALPFAYFRGALPTKESEANNQAQQDFDTGSTGGELDPGLPPPDELPPRPKLKLALPGLRSHLGFTTPSAVSPITITVENMPSNWSVIAAHALINRAWKEKSVEQVDKPAIPGKQIKHEGNQITLTPPTRGLNVNSYEVNVDTRGPSGESLTKTVQFGTHVEFIGPAIRENSELGYGNVEYSSLGAAFIAKLQPAHLLFRHHIGIERQYTNAYEFSGFVLASQARPIEQMIELIQQDGLIVRLSNSSGVDGKLCQVDSNSRTATVYLSGKLSSVGMCRISSDAAGMRYLEFPGADSVVCLPRLDAGKWGPLIGVAVRGLNVTLSGIGAGTFEVPEFDSSKIFSGSTDVGKAELL